MPRILQHPVPDSLLAKIGDITVSFALLENQLQSLASHLILQHQRIGQIVTAELSFRSLRAFAESLYIERFGEDEDHDRLRKLLSRAESLEITRNQITHSVWAAGSSATTITRVKTTAKERQGLRFRFENTDINDLLTVADDIKILALEIQSFDIQLLTSGKPFRTSGER